MSSPHDIDRYPDDEKKVSIEHLEAVPGVNHHDDTAEGAAKRKRFNANTQLDDAAKILEEASAQGAIQVTAEDRKRVLRRIDLFVCVPMMIVYFLQQVRPTPFLCQIAANRLVAARQILGFLRRRIRPNLLDQSPRHSILLAHLDRLYRSTRVSTALVLCAHRVSRQVLGHVQHDFVEYRNHVHR